MKVEIDVELPECIAEKWEVVAVRRARAGDFVPLATLNGVTVIEMASEMTGLHAILRRKDNPKDWWPEWITADRMTFEVDGVIQISSGSEDPNYWLCKTSLIDFSWIPEHLKRSGRTFENPWKAKVQE